MGRAVLALLACLALSGCGGTWSSGSASSRPPAEANVRAVIPALEAYYADNGTYGGATLAKLRTRYDAGLPDVRIVRAGAHGYCVESRAGGSAASKNGPAAEIVPGTCS